MKFDATYAARLIAAALTAAALLRVIKPAP